MSPKRILGLGVFGLGLAAQAASGSSTYVALDYPGFSVPPPAGTQELGPASGFGQIWDFYGRTIATAEPTTPSGTTLSLDLISMKTWTNDADLFKIKVADPSSFTAYTTGTTIPLAIFAEDGTALAATSGGGVANQLTGAVLPGPGFYYIGVARTLAGVPRNNANEALFSFSSPGVVTPLAVSDLKLSTDPFIAWTLNNGSLLIGPGSFSAGTVSHIRLTGTNFSVPEPASISLLAMGGLVLARRRRA